MIDELIARLEELKRVYPKRTTGLAGGRSVHELSDIIISLIRELLAGKESESKKE